MTHSYMFKMLLLLEMLPDTCICITVWFTYYPPGAIDGSHMPIIKMNYLSYTCSEPCFTLESPLYCDLMVE